MKTIVITGGSGFIGTKLTELLLSRGYAVHVLDRAVPRIARSALTYTVCDTSESLPNGVIDGAYGVLNLAGKTIGERWTQKVKQDIYSSRIRTTQNIVSAIASARVAPPVLVSASAVGYYGNTRDTLADEAMPTGTDFLATVARDWENEAVKAGEYGVRVAIVRTAHVVGAGGILASLEKIFARHLGGYFGSGSQYTPWVSLDDILHIYLFLLEHPTAEGAFNTAAGTPITQKAFMRAFAKARGYFLVWRIPQIAVRIVLGEFAESLLTGQKVTSEKLKKLGYVFLYEKLEEVLRKGK